MKERGSTRLTGLPVPPAAWLIATAVVFAALAVPPGRAQIVRQNFESWPDTGDVWSNYTQNGWTLQDSQVRATRGGFSPAIGTNCCWLNDYDATGNTWVQAPFMVHGAGTITFQARSPSGTTGEQFFDVQTSADGTNWTTVAAFDRINDNWAPYTHTFTSLAPTFVRICKVGDQATNSYLGLDEIEITPAPGVQLYGLAHVPAAPSSVTPVHIQVTAVAAEASSNLFLSAWYRQGTAGTFTAIGMTNTAGTSYRTLTPIPSGFAGIVQYYVRCDYDGVGISPLFIPASGPLSPTQFDTQNPYLNTSMRQLQPSTHRTPLIISEIMYNPREGLTSNSLAFVELFNTEPMPQDIGGYRLSGDVAYTFPLGTTLGARAFVVVATDPAAVAAHYGLTDVAGPLLGSLPNGGGVVRLRNREDALLLEAEYDSAMPWPVAADGTGHSLVLARPDYGEGEVRAWSASRLKDGSPGAADPVTNTPIDQVLINEVLAHTDDPMLDYVELYNAGNQSVDIGGCTLSDGPNTVDFTIPPGTLLGARQWIAFNQTNLGFSLLSNGDEVFLGAPDGARIVDAIRFPAQANGVALGRYPDGAPTLTTLTSLTPGSANAAARPRIEDVVINEIMYHPISGRDRDEYIELLNTSTVAVAIGGWQLDGGVSFTFPPGAAIPATGYVVVARSATNLLARYAQLHEANTFGDYAGQLADSGERIALLRPDNPLQPGQTMVVVDEVTYADGDHWGLWADGGGSSLELRDPHSDNRLPMNWAGSDETTKAAWTTVDASGIVDNGTGVSTQLRIMMLQAGECLVDNIVVEGDNSTPLCMNESFESGLGAWTLLGNHSRGSWDAEGFGGGHSLHLRASSAGMEGTWSGWSEAFLNHARAPLISTPVSGTNIHIRAKVRWLAGWPALTLTLQGFYMSADVLIDPPQNLGTPGQRNSRFLANAPPAIQELAHAPIQPSAGQPLVVSARVDDPDGIGAVLAHYRLDPSTTITTITMRDDGTAGDALAGDGIFSATLPGQTAGTILAFHVSAVDASGSATNLLPSNLLTGVPTCEALVRFGDTTPPGILGDYHLWISSSNVTRWNTISGGKYSNEPIDLTLNIGGYRAIYNAAGRYRGLWRQYGSPVDSGAYSIDIPKADRLFGEAELKLDQIGQTGGDSTRQGEGYCFWAARRIGLPASQTRYIRLFVNGNDRGILHDLQTPTLDFCKSWFNDADPVEFKNSGWVGDCFSKFVDANGNYKRARYRWMLAPRRPSVPSDDYQPAFDIVEAAITPSDAAYTARMDALLEMRRWTGFFAVCGATGAWDHYGWSYTHNSFIYLPPHQGGSIFIYDMDHSLSGGLSLFPGAGWPVPYRLFNIPAFRRQYWALLKDLVDGPMSAADVNAHMDGWYNTFIASGASVSQPTAFKSWIASARATIQSQLAPYQAAFSVDAASLSSTSTIVSISGTAPPAIATLALDGITNRWTFSSVTNWSLQVGLPPGTNVITATGFDWRGAPLLTTGLTVTVNAPAPPSPVEQIIITEIMYHAPNPYGDYVELLNRGTQPVDLRGWRLNGADVTFDGGSIIQTGQYAIVAENLTAYQRLYSNAEVVVGTYLGSLDDGGETLTLEMPAGGGAWTTIDRVTYDDDPPWPTQADGWGQSLQLLDVNQDNNRPGNWGVVVATPELTWRYKSVTGVGSNGNPRVMVNAKFHMFARNAGTVLVDRIALVTGTVAESGQNLLTNGEFELPMAGTWYASGNHAASAIVGQDVHSGAGSLAIVATAAGGITGSTTNTVSQPRPMVDDDGGHPFTLSYWYRESLSVTSLTASLDFSTVGLTHSTMPPPITTPRYSPGASSSVADTLPQFPPLWINEVMPSNVMAWADNAAEFDPWLELYNAGTSAVALADYRLSNRYDDPGLWAFPTDAVIEAGMHLLIWTDAQTNQTTDGVLHAAFTLDPTTGTVVLARDYFGRTLVMDSLDYDTIGPDFSFGSYPEGDPRSRQIFHHATPGSANNPASLPTQVFINEWMADNVSSLQDPTSIDQGNLGYDDWFELYNPSPQPVNLGGYYLTDKLSITNKFSIPGGTIIPAAGFLLVWADEDTADTGPGTDIHANFKLSAGGEAIGIFRPDGTALDAVTFGAQYPNRSEGAWPDGTRAYAILSPPTPRGPNAVLSISAVDPAPGDGGSFAWSAVSGTVYTVWAGTNLIAPLWIPIATMTAQGATIIFEDPAFDAYPERFYRIGEPLQ